MRKVVLGLGHHPFRALAFVTTSARGRNQLAVTRRCNRPEGHRLKVGFLFNHSVAHQVAHSLPIAAAIAEFHPQVELTLFVCGGASEDEVRRLWSIAGHSKDDQRIEKLAPATRTAEFLTKASGDALPAERISILSQNAARFEELDALVVPEKTSTLLKTRFGLDRLALIHTRHGAGDRAIGFDKASGRFDLVLLSGEKIRQRLDDAGLLKPGGHAIVGYPKFDALLDQPYEPVFQNDRPTVLYNPHPSPALSSWYRMGPQVLEWFAQQDRFNLIFAPHVMLFARQLTVALSPFSIAKVPEIPSRIAELPHIHIDKGSEKSVDMTYVRAADIYLGDASSQVYEFLAEPRPCVFLNPNEHHWQDNPDFTHWQTGRVAANLDEMKIALGNSLSSPDAFREVQEKLFAETFDLRSQRSSARAADAIVSWLDENRAR